MNLKRARILWVILATTILIFFQNACKAPNYKQLVGEWEIKEFHVVMRDYLDQLVIDTVLKDCGKFVFYKVDDFSRKENKGKIKGYVVKPVYLMVNGVYEFYPEQSWFEGDAREPLIAGNDIDFWFAGLTKYTVTKREGDKLTATLKMGSMYTETVVIVKK